MANFTKDLKKILFAMLVARWSGKEKETMNLVQPNNCHQVCCGQFHKVKTYSQCCFEAGRAAKKILI